MDTLIISGGNIGIDLALGLLKIKRFDHIIGVDGGLKFCYDHKIVPTRIVGDFDTLSPEILTWYKKNTQIRDPGVQSGKRCHRHTDRRGAGTFPWK